MPIDFYDYYIKYYDYSICIDVIIIIILSLLLSFPTIYK